MIKKIYKTLSSAVQRRNTDKSLRCTPRKHKFTCVKIVDSGSKMTLLLLLAEGDLSFHKKTLSPAEANAGILPAKIVCTCLF